MRTGRTCPDLDATLFFDPDEIRGAYLLAKKKPPATPPTIRRMPASNTGQWKLTQYGDDPYTRRR